MSAPAETKSNSDERVLGALAHGSAIVFFFGMAIAAAIWSIYRRKSKYIAFQALQALGYQVISVTLFILFYLLLSILIMPISFGAIIFLSQQSPSSSEFFPFFYVLFFWGAVFLCFGLYVLVALIGAGFNLAGKEFRYPLLGKWLARYVRYQPAVESNEASMNEEREERWVSAMSHASVVIPMWGMIVPLITWIMDKSRSQFLRFQSLQALVYQAIGFLGYALSMVLYLFGTFFFVGSIIFLQPSRDSRWMSIPIIVFFLIMLLFVFVYLVLMPLCQILGQWAAIRILQGCDYRYPLLGNWLKRLLDRSAPVPVGDSK
ncbi:MAG TPA: DUF4870 domain-containing protein [Anaerolineales bacterium]|nr:DUF4870 domain-containing protein [Anaerolineales bacterium]